MKESFNNTNQNLVIENNKVLISRSFFEENKIVIGIDQSGNFLVKLASGFSPINDDNMVCLIRLLSIDYDKFENDIRQMIVAFNIESRIVKLNVADFPFIEIVKTALMSKRDHWIELSMMWLKRIGKEFFFEEIENILKDKKNGQSIRHLLLRL